MPLLVVVLDLEQEAWWVLALGAILEKMLALVSLNN